MDTGGSEGHSEEEKRCSPTQDMSDNRQTGGANETAEDSGVTVPPPEEGSLQDQLDHEQLQAREYSIISQSQSGASGTEAPPVASDQTEMLVPPQASVLLSAATAINYGDEAAGRVDGENEDEEEEELVVLSPEHPLMKRFQTALKNHLTKQLERLNLDLREELATERAEATRREEMGVELYSVQQELVRLQAALESRHEANIEASKQHQQAQKQLDSIRHQYRNSAKQAHKMRSEVSQKQAEVEKLTRHLFYMQDMKAELHSDIMAMKTASRKAQAEKTHIDEQKHKQDLYVNRLTKHIERQTEQIAEYDIQTLAQKEETKATKETLAEAQMEIDSLAVEYKQLLQQWDSSLIGMRKRDEAHTAMQEALRLANQQVRSLDTEIEGYKKSITQEEEQNELLTVLLNRVQLDSATSQKLISQIQNQQEALQAKYSTYTRMLQETENTLNRLNVESGVRQSELTALRKQVEKESATRLELEEKIMSKIQEQLTHDNATKYSHRLTERLAAHKREREAQLSRLENDIATVSLETSEVTLRLEAVARLQAELEQEMSRRHGELSAAEAVIAKLIIVSERKQSTINIYNKKIQQIVESTGHKDLSPLEIQARTLIEQLEKLGSEMKDQQQLWLRQQGELIRLAQEKQTLRAALQTQQTQLTMLQQRKVRTENEIEQEKRGQTELESHNKELMADMQRLNTLLNKKSKLHHNLEQDNILTENDFLHRLREAERDSIEMQMKLEMIEEETSRLLSSITEAERQIMLWEKKIQLVIETHAAVNSEMGQGDIRTMKAEIHRMEVRYAHLKKQQEHFMREMEAVVARRETIVTRSEAQARDDRRQPTHADFNSILHNLRRKIAETQKQAEECDGVIKELQETQRSLDDELKEKQRLLSELHSATAVLTSDLRSLQYSKDKNLLQMVAMQGRTKQLQMLRDGRYSAVATSEATLESAMEQKRERLHAISSILMHVIQDFPQHQAVLRKPNLTLAARLLTAPP
ncbi:coiled-coil domain-containing protein 40 [Chanos chanos]|uniref:Coiled-coil domain-containing protein 40 n=1 Tax=Chanos chanos TaxID=29144 RepID=A0A6J2W5Q6_CHACN|nr:coiled-coil domain-containing protein 40 [Chanos chanos]